MVMISKIFGFCLTSLETLFSCNGEDESTYLKVYYILDVFCSDTFRVS